MKGSLSFQLFFSCGRLEVHEGGQQLKRKEVSPPTHLWNVSFLSLLGWTKEGGGPTAERPELPD